MLPQTWTWPPTLPSAWLEAIAAPALYFLDPSRRVFAPFLIAALVIACVVVAARRRAGESFLAALFPKEIWSHPSARLDNVLFAAGAVLRAVTLPSTTIPAAAVAAVVHYLWLVKIDIGPPLVYAAVSAVLLGLRLWFHYA